MKAGRACVVHSSFGWSVMFEIVIAVTAAVSVSIFLVHAIEAYLTH